MVKSILSVATVLAVGLSASVTLAADKAASDFRDAFLNGKATWADVEARAKEEGEVNWFHWGGSEKLNAWIERAVVPVMREKGITLKTTRIGGTREAVDLVLADKQAGKGIGEGSVDMIWLNGDNFYTLAQQDALFGSFANKVPHAVNFAFDPADPRSQLNLADFGTPTEAREMPWSGEQYVCYIDTSRLSQADAPKDFKELESWLVKNPGRFTYVKPPHYIGNTFVQTVMYAHGGGFKPFQKSISEFTPESFAALVKPGFEYLKRIEPNLLPVYPQNQAANQAMYNNGEVDMACEFGLYFVANQRESGAFSDTTETVLFPKSGMIKNKNFLAIPSNSPHPAAALVLANVMSTVDLQISKLKDIGYPLGVDIFKLSAEDQKRAVDAAPKQYGVTDAELAGAAVADTNASLVKVIEAIWIEYIERKSDKPFNEIVANAMKKSG
ncbi:ABC transporter substrate-binding protein [Sneathiella sp. P13V-1]|uniref:ABC transporter substrate-binding protein n=1 Tax=Sneathiella sp. P13V-1 TaxID=2697366 RepID=UPI00187B6F2A|nr:ABC transporter substrate-binding protein [Sneathiella sp. P13V-1]MBE7637266.1 ABC transporter substrate-binding protein [Sneathiella sp. P13V-1]